MKCNFCKKETKEKDLRLVQIVKNVYEGVFDLKSAGTVVQEHYLCKSCLKVALSTQGRKYYQ